MASTVAYKKRKRRRKRIMGFTAVLLFFLVLLILVILGIKLVGKLLGEEPAEKDGEMLLSLESDMRTGQKMEYPEKIIIRRSSIDNAGAEEMRNYYERAGLLSEYLENKPDSVPHFCIGIDGIALQIVPTDEIAKGNTGAVVLEYTGTDEYNVPEAVVEKVNKLIAKLKAEYSIVNENIITVN